jgi:hypothetical protein
MRPLHLMPQHMHLLLGSLFWGNSFFDVKSKDYGFDFFFHIHIFWSWKLLSFAWQLYWIWKPKVTNMKFVQNSCWNVIFFSHAFDKALLNWNPYCKLTPPPPKKKKESYSLIFTEFPTFAVNVMWLILTHQCCHLVHMKFWIWLWGLIWNVICKNVLFSSSGSPIGKSW